MNIEYEITGDLKVLWGIGNAAHRDFAGNVAEAVRWAQDPNEPEHPNITYKEVYIPPQTNPYQLSSPIEIYTDGFALRGAGIENTIMEFSGSTEYAIRVKPPDLATALLKGVRLADFTIRREGSSSAKGGIYLEDCHGTIVERVRACDWSQRGQGYGFKASNSGTIADEAGRIVCNQCSGENCFHGVWLTGVQPMQRCSINGFRSIGNFYSGVATGGGTNKLIDDQTDFVNDVGVVAGDLVFDERQHYNRQPK